MNPTLEDQITRTRRILVQAEETRDLGLAKFALGLISGALIAVIPEDEHYSIIRNSLNAAESSNLNDVLDTAHSIARRGLE